MRNSSKSSYNSRALWRRVGHGLLLVAFSWSVIVGTNFSRTVFAASPTNVQSQSQQQPDKDVKVKEKASDEEVVPAPAPAPAKAGQPNRNVLAGTPLTFTNSSVITINDNTSATPYPSGLSVSGIVSNVVGARVSLYGLSHTFPGDIDILLVAPSGQKTVLMSDRGGSTDILDVNLTFDDTATTVLGSGVITNGIYRPSDDSTNNTAVDTFTSPAPTGPYSVTLGVFNYANPNGTWQLYVTDDVGDDAGRIAGGWALALYVTDQPAVFATGGSNQTATVATAFMTSLQATLRDTAGSPLSGAVITFTTPTSGASGTFAGNSSFYTGTTDAQGVVTASVFTANTVAGSYQVTVTSSLALTSANFNLTNTGGPPASLTVNSGNGQSTLVSKAFGQPLSVVARDAYNNISPIGTVTFTAPGNGASGTFGSNSRTYTATPNAVGIVTASIFTANLFAGSYVVTATGSGGGTPVSFNLTNLPVTLTVVSGSGQQVVTNNNFSQTLTVLAVDSNNAPVSGLTVNFTAPATGASGTFAGNVLTNQALTKASGQANSSIFTANAITGTYVVTAAIGNSSPVSFTLTNIEPSLVQLTSSAYTVSEGAGSAVVTLTRSGTSMGVVVANLKINDLTTTDADYVITHQSSQLDTTFNPGTGTPGETYQVYPLPDGKVLLGGNFSSYNGQNVGRIARLNADGSLDTSFQSTGAGANGTVHGLAVQPDGKIIIVGGDFSTYNGVTRNRVARLNADGSLDTDFLATGTGATGAVFRTALQPDGKVLIGGSFTSFNGTNISRIARLNADGSLDSGFTLTGSGLNGTVWAIAVQADGKILIGGEFTGYNGTTTNRIARLNADGSLDTTFVTTLGANATIWSILVPDAASGKILIAGDVTGYNNSSVGYIARLNGSDGSLDTSFTALNSGAADKTIRTMALQPDGKVLFGGDFSTFNNIAVNHIGRLNADGSFDLSVLSAVANGGPNALLWSIASQADGKILVGGDLTSYDGQSRNHIARAGGYSVVWADGDTAPKSFRLPLVDDVLSEGDEQLTISIDAVRSTASIGSQISTTVTILDNESEGALLSVVSGSSQSTSTQTPFAQPLVARLQSAGFAPLVGQIVTFTAPAGGASGTFANGSNVYTGTTDASGTVTTSVFTANAQSGTYTVTATSNGVALPASFVLTNTPCSAVVVTNVSDNGKGTVCGTLSYSLLNVSSGVTVTFNLTQGNTITFTGSLTVSVKAGVGINGGGGANGITLNGGGVSGDGLMLRGNNVLTNLTVRNFGGREIVAPATATGNKFYRIIIES
jgi:uncharacterized delta-60 repeat protein